MEGLMRHWKLLAFKYKRETTKIHEQLAEILVKMNPEEIRNQQIVTGTFNGLMVSSRHDTMVPEFSIELSRMNFI